MAKARQDGEASAESAAKRVRHLLLVLWSGNRSAMARDIGMSHTAINRVVSGQRPPGRSLLSAICCHPKVNPSWLLTGEGEPLLAEREETGTGGWVLPIARKAFLGPPEENRRLLTGDTFPIPVSFYRDSRYWLEVQAGDAALRDAGERLKPGDLLLMETDASFWRDLHAVHDRLAVIRTHAKDESQLKLVKLDFGVEHEEGPSLLASIFDDLPDRSELRRSIHIYERLDGQLEFRTTYHKPSRSGDGEEREHKRVSEMTFLPVLRTISPQDIVSVGIMIVRR